MPASWSGSITTAKGSLAVVALCILLVAPGAWRGIAAPGPCRQSGTTLLVEHRDGLALVDPVSFELRALPVDPEAARVAGNAQEMLERLAFPTWRVIRTSDERGRRVRVVDSRGGEQVFDLVFEHRIELPAISSSSSGRFTLHVQANNVASEVTILDAWTGRIKVIEIPHDAPLAAYAIAVAFSPDERCVAVSMDRVGGDGAETWLIDLQPGGVERVPVADAFVLQWLPYQV